MFQNKYTSTVSVILQQFCNARGKCLRTTYCLLRGMFTFQCSLWCDLSTNEHVPSSVTVT